MQVAARRVDPKELRDLDAGKYVVSEPQKEDKVDVKVNVDIPLVPIEPLPVIKKKRGFASMSREQVSAISSKGGKAAHAAGTAHKFTTAEAQAAGRKGGTAPHARRGKGPKNPGSAT